MRAADREITATRLRELLHYEPETGVFRWAATRGRRARSGEVAGGRKRDGYVWIGVEGRRYLAHRLAWLWVHGRWPTELIDHINGEPSDNRLSNLREANRSENLRNRKIGRNNTSGFRGVHFHKRQGRWIARVKVYGLRYHLGSFATAEEAHRAYVRAARIAHGRFANLDGAKR